MHKLNDKILVWTDPDSLEAEAKQQIQNVSELPFLFKHVAVMPDAHVGKGATVGTVLATRGAIVPSCIGVDIGCGLCAVRTKYYAKDLPDNLKDVRDGIERRIPLGVGASNKKLTPSANERGTKLIGGKYS